MLMNYVYSAMVAGALRYISRRQTANTTFRGGRIFCWPSRREQCSRLLIISFVSDALRSYNSSVRSVCVIRGDHLQYALTENIGRFSECIRTLVQYSIIVSLSVGKHKRGLAPR